MRNLKYITLEQDIVSLRNKLKSLDDLIDFEAFKKYGKFATSYTRAYRCYDQKRARQIVRRTLRNATRTLETIQLKLIASSGGHSTNVDLINSVMDLSVQLNKIQKLFV